MKRPTRPFAVEIKRARHKTTGSQAAPTWDVAAAALVHQHNAPKPAPAAAAVFQPKPDGERPDPMPRVRRILPALTEPQEIEAAPTPEPPRQPRKPSRVALPEMPPLVRRVMETPEEPGEFEDAAVDGLAPANTAAAEAPPPQPATVATSRPRARSLPGSGTLPPGERWKRRLPKILR